MKISKKASVIELSLTRKLFNMAKDFENVIDLTLGDPDLVPSKEIRQAASDAVCSGKTRYSANAGLLPLREAIAENFKKEYGIEIDPNRETMVTVGGMEGLYLCISSLVDDGDEVIILAPYYVNYRQMIRMCGGVPVIVNTREEDGFRVSAQQLEQVITEKTVAIVINTPCNPTGAILDHDTLEKISDLAKKYDLTVISDEVYRSLIYDGVKHESIVTFPEMKERTVVIDSFSKRFSMTGYRVGYAIAPVEIMTAMIKMQENIAACAPLPSQYAAITALNECADDPSVAEEFQVRRDYIYNAINSIDGMSCIKPKATFYLYVNIEKTGLNCLDFAYQLLEKEQVAVVPGITYGEGYENYIRIAYTVKVDVLKEAVKRIQRFVEGL